MKKNIVVLGGGISGYGSAILAKKEEIAGIPTADYLKEDARNTSVLYAVVAARAEQEGVAAFLDQLAACRGGWNL